MKTILWFLVFATLVSSSTAQSLSVNTDGSTASASAMLDVKSTDKGVLIPRLTSLQRTGIGSPAIGLMVYDTDSSSFSYYTGSAWVFLKGSDYAADAWNTKGNSSTIDGTNFIGTKDNIPLTIRVNNQISGRIDHFLNNTFFGYESGNSNSTGTRLTSIGDSALFSNISGANNTAVGSGALKNNTTGNNNFSLGNAGLYNNTIGSDNIAIGDSALFTSSAPSHMVAIGSHALFNTFIGGNNTAVGDSALYKNTSGFGNTAIGSGTLRRSTTASNNTAVGDSALNNATNGGRNTAVGYQALFNLTTGIQNTAVGYQALSNVTSGSTNTAIGNGANINPGTLSNATAIGFGATVTLSNSLVLGSGANVGIGVSAPAHRLELGLDDAAKPGTNSWTVVSDARLKQNIHPYSDGLQQIMQIKPVRFHYNAASGYDTQSEYVGIIAQDLQKIAPYMIGNSKRNGQDYLDVNNGAMTYMLINAVQEQEKAIEVLKEEIKELKALIKK